MTIDERIEYAEQKRDEAIKEAEAELRDKQIVEMAKTILDVDRSYYGMECDEIQAKVEATALYNAGYRKASEVAREIFAEIEKFNRPPLPECAPVYIIKANEYAELKKKYTEGEG